MRILSVGCLMYTRLIGTRGLQGIGVAKWATLCVAKWGLRIVDAGSETQAVARCSLLLVSETRFSPSFCFHETCVPGKPLYTSHGRQVTMLSQCSCTCFGGMGALGQGCLNHCILTNDLVSDSSEIHAVAAMWFICLSIRLRGGMAVRNIGMYMASVLVGSIFS